MSKSSTMAKTGLAFSGGGIRSAAFCSGVLRRLLHKGVSIDYLSTVSGGGFTGASYMDWKFRNGNKDDPVWHKKYFENFRIHINALCDCYNPCRGFIDGVVIFLILFTVTIGLSALTAFAFAIPTAYVVDLCVGETLRTAVICSDQEVMENSSQQTNSSSQCSIQFDPNTNDTYTLLLGLVSVFLVSYFLRSLSTRGAPAYFIRLFRNLSAFALAVISLPLALELYILYAPSWTTILIIVVAVIVWIGFPVLREKVTMAVVVYLYAYVVKWRVFKQSIWGVQYSYDNFWITIWIAGVVVWLFPYLSLFRMNVIHQYAKYRLQRSFFSPESTVRSSCMTCRDLVRWMGIVCCKMAQEHVNDRPLTLGDLVNVQPEYKCNVTVNNWRKTGAGSEEDYEVLILSPTGIERIDFDKDEENKFGSKGYLHPRDIKLSTAMTTSAAAISYDLGNLQDSKKSFRELRIVLGLGIGSNIIAQPGLTTNCLSKVVPLIVQLCFGVVTIGFPLVRYHSDDDDFIWGEMGAIMFVCFMGILAVISILPTGASNPGLIERFTRWCIINISHVRLLRQLVGVTNNGPNPPPILALSDGGHVENLGLLSLFKLRLPRIVSVNGGSLGPDDTYASDLLRAIKQAREKLHCSFTGVSGRDIEEDIREQFVETPPGNQPRSYRFKVQYYERRGFVGKEVGEGEVMLLMPRHPDDGIREFEDSKWNDFDYDVKLDLDESAWGSGPALKASEVDRLSGCCCECCHSRLCSVILNPLMGRFPMQSTTNQVYTASQFTAYHREGYRACLEGQAAEFLNEGQGKGEAILDQPQPFNNDNGVTVVNVDEVVA